MSATGVRVHIPNKHLPYGAFTRVLSYALKDLGFHVRENPDHSATVLENSVYVEVDNMREFLRKFERFDSLQVVCFYERNEMHVTIRDTVD